MTQKQANGLVTHPGVLVRGPFLSLPMKEGGERLRRALARWKAGVKARQGFTYYLWPGQCASRCGDKDFILRP